MNLRDSWENGSILIDHLARQLTLGRLGLFLGAGVSQFYGLPDWDTLMQRLFAKHGEIYTKGEDPIAKAGYLRAQYYKQNASGFKIDLAAALYQGQSLDFAKIRQNPTLAAIGSLVMSSKRGSAAKVFTLNYDDLLENYLEYHGFTTAAVWSDRHWARNDDVTVFHPHGFLPLAERAQSDDVVLGSSEYHKIMQSDLWRPLLQTVLRTHTFLYIGLSGTDMHLQHLLQAIDGKHAIVDERIAYHTVRFALVGKKDEIAPVLEPQGVFTHQIVDYDALPDFLFQICQSARKLRMTGD
jgi:hypothetical protein